MVLCASYASERLPLKTLHLTEFSPSTLGSTWLLAPGSSNLPLLVSELLLIDYDGPGSKSGGSDRLQQLTGSDSSWQIARSKFFELGHTWV